MINYIHKYAEMILPDELIPEINKKTKSIQQGDANNCDSGFNLFQIRKDVMSRYRTLSVIKEEAEGLEE